MRGTKSQTPPPVGIFSTPISHGDLKLGTHMQRHNTNTPNKFQGHSPFITLFTPHMCDFQGHRAINVNIAIYPHDHIRM